MNAGVGEAVGFGNAVSRVLGGFEAVALAVSLHRVVAPGVAVHRTRPTARLEQSVLGFMNMSVFNAFDTERFGYAVVPMA